jgi:hypothetical protein
MYIVRGKIRDSGDGAPTRVRPRGPINPTVAAAAYAYYSRRLVRSTRANQYRGTHCK